MQFLNRLGELSQTRLIMDSIENINKGERMFIEAEQYAWGLAEGRIPELMDPIMDQKIAKGLQVKMIIPETDLSTVPAIKTPNVELRGISDIPVILGITEKEATVCFRFIGGRVDYAGFSGKDPAFLNWTKDLFLYYWEKGKRT